MRRAPFPMLVISTSNRALACAVAATLALGLGPMAGCGPTIVDITDDSSSTGAPAGSSTSTSGVDSGSSTGNATETSTSTGASVDESDDDAATTSTFLPQPDGGFGDDDCSIFLQDCPEGQKCMPWANDGGNSWNATRCTAIAEEPGAPGDPCMVEGTGVSGIDTCQMAAMCWDVDPATNEGTCVAFCTGSEADPICEDPDTSCILSATSPLALCLPNCSPLAQDCPDGQGCYAINENFGCVPDGSEVGGAPGDPCQYINVCEPGLLCGLPEWVPGCMGPGCCTPFCALGDRMPPCLPGQDCVAFYEPGTAPPGYEDVGMCAVP